MSLRWRIYYGDGSVYDSEMGTPYDAPTRDVQVILAAHRDHGSFVYCSNDFYFYIADADEWAGGNWFELFDYLDSPGPKRVLFGRELRPNQRWRDMLDKALRDPDFPPKTGWEQGEFRPPEPPE